MKLDENGSFTITNAGFIMKHSGFNYESLWFSHEIHDVNYTNSKNIGCSLANMFQTPGPRIFALLVMVEFTFIQILTQRVNLRYVNNLISCHE